MNIPAQAFADLHPQDMRPGTLFKFRDSWALRVDNQKTDGASLPAFVMLEGERIGSYFEVGNGMASCLAVVEPFGWYPSILESAVPCRATMPLRLSVSP